MNTRIAFPLAAFLLVAVSVAASRDDSSRAVAPVPGHIVDLPAVIVHPAAEDAAYYQAHRIVNLDVVTVHPDASDQALFVADSARLVDCLSC